MEKILKPFTAQGTCGRMHSVTLLKNNLPLHFSLAFKNKAAVSHKQQRIFFKDLIHEMGTPLTILNCNIEELKEKYPDEKALDSCSKELEILQNSLYLNEIFLALETQEIVQEYFEPISISKITKCICSQFQGVLKKRFLFDVEENLFIRGQEDILSYIIMNLIQNAQKHTSGDEKILLSLSAKDKKIFLKVSDEGMGISAEDAEYLFTKYYRTPLSKRKGIRGTGLGLCIMKELVESLGAVIHVRGEKDKGATFSLEFPQLCEEKA